MGSGINSNLTEPPVRVAFTQNGKEPSIVGIVTWSLPRLRGSSLLTTVAMYSSANNVLCLILLPSRELSMQVYENVMQFINNTSYKFTAQLLIGGKKVDDDISKIKETIPNIIIATPGRFIDIDDKEKLSFSELQLLILDEADRMLDMGFEVAVSQILSKLPKQRRTGLFSATVTSNVENIIKAGMRNPVFIDINVNEMNKDKEDIFISEKDVNNKRFLLIY